MYQTINTYVPADSNVCSTDSHIIKTGFIVANIHLTSIFIFIFGEEFHFILRVQFV
jgi:hypothetical protein